MDLCIELLDVNMVMMRMSAWKFAAFFDIIHRVFCDLAMLTIDFSLQRSFQMTTKQQLTFRKQVYK